MQDLIAVRTHAHSQRRFRSPFANFVINALSDDFHPCQLLVDVQTFMEVRGPSETRVWPDRDGNNTCQSYNNAAAFDSHCQLPAQRV